MLYFPQRIEEEVNMTEMKANKLKTLDMVYIAIFTVLIAICSWITIPTLVPFTLQTFAVFCTVGLLGGRRGTLAVLLYIILGAVGIPVFAGFTGGIGFLFGPTGGYIIGFLACALLYWLITKLFGNKTLVSIISMITGLAVLYIFGTVWFMIIYSQNSGAVGLATVLGWCVIPFIIPDLIKIAVAILLIKRVAPHVAL
jgi:biotin transport system substrate-specific component